MFNLDRQQFMIFLIMCAIILALTGYIIFGQKTIERDSVRMITDDLTLEVGANNEISNKNTTGNKTEWNTEAETGTEQEQQIEGAIEPVLIKVYITGQVKNPGVIEVLEGSRLVDVVDAAGGLLEDADLKRVNLAARVQDEGMYIIFKPGEQAPDLLPDSLPSNSSGSRKVNINTANQQLLETLPRIGPVTAQSIIDYRERYGSFKSTEDIKNVSGIGDKTFEDLRDFITVE